MIGVLCNANTIINVLSRLGDEVEGTFIEYI
jgi:hypothetical protein